MVRPPQPLHWNRPPQSPVWQCPVPALPNTQPVRPQKRVFRLSGAVMVTLWPAGSTQPVAESGEVALGAAGVGTARASPFHHRSRPHPRSRFAPNIVRILP